MNFFDAIKTCLAKYVDFNGRASRPEYWYFVLFIVLGQICLGIVFRPLAAAFALAVLLPHLAVGARRLHDTDRSAWWLLLGFIPLIGAIVLLVWFSQRGDEHANRFGDPPMPALPS
jgi:uncharacterized membrane protein YhaH (DUF805 family)